MHKHDFDYHLPADRIAQQPRPHRRDARLLSLDRATGAFVDHTFVDIVELLAPGDLLVFNDTRVLPARLYGTKACGGRIELLLERIIGTRHFTAKIRANKPARPGTALAVGDFNLTIEGVDDDLYALRIDADATVGDLLATAGHVPLPPYIRRDDGATDRERYQTVWAAHDGAVAAPTAGLHFDHALLDALAARGVDSARLTLHVGSGTYQRLRAGAVDDQRLHAERLSVDAATCAAIDAARARGSRIVAVGTTAVRGLETAARAAPAGRLIAPYHGETSLFLKPGDPFYSVDAVITNFHEPQSSLLILVSAFAGRHAVLAAYRHAVAAGYRFLSYGDAMFIG